MRFLHLSHNLHFLSIQIYYSYYNPKNILDADLLASTDIEMRNVCAEAHQDQFTSREQLINKIPNTLNVRRSATQSRTGMF